MLSFCTVDCDLHYSDEGLLLVLKKCTKSYISITLHKIVILNVIDYLIDVIYTEFDIKIFLLNYYPHFT